MSRQEAYIKAATAAATKGSSHTIRYVLQGVHVNAASLKSSASPLKHSFAMYMSHQ
jgi:hypothetical protein